MRSQSEGSVRHGRFKIESLLVGLIAFTLIGSTALLTAVSIHQQNTMLTKTTLQKNFEAARNLAISANTIKELMFEKLGAMASYWTEQRLPIGEEASPLLGKLLVGDGMFGGALLISGAGNVLVTTPATGFAAGDRLDEAAELIFTGRETGPWMSAPFVAPGGHRVVLALHPMKSGNSQSAVYLAGLIDLQQNNVFSNMLIHTIKSEPGTYAYLIDGTGVMMMNAQEDRAGEILPAAALLATFGSGHAGDQPNPPDRQGMQRGQGGPGPAGPRERPMSVPLGGPGGPGGQPGPGNDGGPPRVAILQDGHGKDVLVGYLRVGDLSWGMVVQSPAEIVTHAKREFLATQLKWSIPLIVAFLLLSLWTARKLATPFAKLTSAARSIAAGDRAGHPPFESHWNYEAHHLARAMMTAVQGLQSRAEEMSLQARTDHLTGLMNRGGLDEWLSTHGNDKFGYALLIIDIDHFKNVNDTFGHQTGDETLIHLAHILMSVCRKTDLVCRIGGEEFVALLPGERLEGASLVAEQLRSKVENTISPTGQPITVSIGMACCPMHGEDFETLFQRADEALYEAKGTGRNRAIAYGNHVRS
ncbi:diguanylate cyclase [Paenibacillus oryzisoli]|uniref:sensor domain-containing diguanylate cyclase n=1 Tax=Paenibacillus oryzisoli TaxID=1850517 RepID=UPI003D26647E